MPSESALELLRVLPEPHLIVAGSGMVVAANPAALRFFAFPPEAGEGAGVPFAALVADPPERVAEYLRACSGTRSLVPGAVTVRGRDGAPHRHRCEGAAMRPRSAAEPSLVLLRVRDHESSLDRFSLLTRQVDELTREVRRRRVVEQERERLLVAEMEARAELEEQAIELEQQREEAESLAEELEAANEGLADALRLAEEARREAEAASRAKTEFLAVMSHELRTPLNAIAGYTDLLLAGVPEPLAPVHREYIERLRQAQLKLLGLVNSVLSFARIEAGQHDLRPEAVPVAALFDAVEPLIAPQLRARELVFERAPHPPALAVRADHDAAVQVLLNLLANAVKFTPPGGRVGLGARATPGAVHLEVRDSGIGIAPEKQEAIFDPFVRVDSRYARATEGIGLGLAISRDLARAMGGDVTVASAPGQGSTFALVLPAAEG